MRLVSVKAPEGQALNIAEVAFAVGVDQVSTRRLEVLNSDMQRASRDVVDVETSTPKAKAFIDAVVQSPFFDPESFSIVVRKPRSVVNGHTLSEITSR